MKEQARLKKDEVQERVSSNPVPVAAVDRRRSSRILVLVAACSAGDGERGWTGALKRTVKEFQEDNLTDWAAALTYYACSRSSPR